MNYLAELASKVDVGSSDGELLALANNFRDNGYDDIDAIASLAESLANSGAIECFFNRTADVASTGGPSSLTTLLCPLFLVLAGWKVPKVTVPGRPAGGIDVLATIPGYNTKPDVTQFRQWLSAASYVHAEAADRWAPLDGRLFALRQRHGLQDVAPLVVASILSKKRALRLQRAVVEIRRGPFGNLGNDDDRLRHACALFRRVGERLHIACEAEITGDGAPYQSMIGRGESLLALRAIFERRAPVSLYEHVALCRRLASRAICSSIPEDSETDLKDIFALNLTTQGSSYEAFTERCNNVMAEPRIILKATNHGVLAWNLGSIRAAVRDHQESSHSKDEAGVELFVLGGEVEVNQPIAAVRGGKALALLIQEAYLIGVGGQ